MITRAEVPSCHYYLDEAAPNRMLYVLYKGNKDYR